MARKFSSADAMGGPELRSLMRDWPSIMRQASDVWAQDFAAQIWKRAGDGQWRPTTKQARVMRRLAREFVDATDEVVLIE
jgi:hypothetical protein